MFLTNAISLARAALVSCLLFPLLAVAQTTPQASQHSSHLHDEFAPVLKHYQSLAIPEKRSREKVVEECAQSPDLRRCYHIAAYLNKNNVKLKNAVCAELKKIVLAKGQGEPDSDIEEKMCRANGVGRYLW